MSVIYICNNINNMNKPYLTLLLHCITDRGTNTSIEANCIQYPDFDVLTSELGSQFHKSS